MKAENLVPLSLFRYKTNLRRESSIKDKAKGKNKGKRSQTKRTKTSLTDFRMLSSTASAVAPSYCFAGLQNRRTEAT